MILLQGKLSESWIVAAPGKEAERGRMTRIAEQNGFEFAVRPRNRHYGHCVIDRPFERFAFGEHFRNFGFRVVAAIHCKSRFSFAHLQRSWGKF